MTIGYVALSLVVIVSFSGRFVGQGQPQQAEKPSIEITVVPPRGAGPDSSGTIAGKASAPAASKCKIVVFARTDKWYVQPFAASPYTSIENGTWKTDTHLGNEYAALLVRDSYTPPATTDQLPQISDTVLAIARATATLQPEPKSSPPAKPDLDSREIQFSGYQWRVKSSNGRVGPGPNYFSNNSDNVEVDSQGRLHLRIIQREGKWHCAEVVSTRSFGYGTYRFKIDGAFDGMDPEIVLGLFTWSDAPEYSHREIDVEISRWGDSNNANGQFVVQPYTRSENIVRFQIPPGVTASTHSFIWKADSVFCESLKGQSGGAQAPDAVIRQHSFTKDIPKPGGENARINLWLMAGRPPADGKWFEVVISKFEFVPEP